jgi:hypothetical protein
MGRRNLDSPIFLAKVLWQRLTMMPSQDVYFNPPVSEADGKTTTSKEYNKRHYLF